jgi:hypothetical protein
MIGANRERAEETPSRYGVVWSTRHLEIKPNDPVVTGPRIEANNITTGSISTGEVAEDDGCSSGGSSS